MDEDDHDGLPALPSWPLCVLDEWPDRKMPQTHQNLVKRLGWFKTFFFFSAGMGGKTEVLSYTDFLFANVIWEYWYMNLVTKSPVLMSTHFYYAEKFKYKPIFFCTKTIKWREWEEKWDVEV